jgi:hypothetical protein
MSSLASSPKVALTRLQLLPQQVPGLAVQSAAFHLTAPFHQLLARLVVLRKTVQRSMEMKGQAAMATGGWRTKLLRARGPLLGPTGVRLLRRRFALWAELTLMGAGGPGHPTIRCQIGSRSKNLSMLILRGTDSTFCWRFLLVCADVAAFVFFGRPRRGNFWLQEVRIGNINASQMFME